MMTWRPGIAFLGMLAMAVGVSLWPPATEPETRPAHAGRDDRGEALFWFKGNTHAHARITLQDYTHGDTPRDGVARWYHDHGYHFLSITDHNLYFDPADIAPIPGARSDFLLIPGMEVTSDHRYPGVIEEGERKIHTVAFNTRRVTDWGFEDPDKSAIITLQARRIRAAGGVPILSHPNYRFQVELPDILGAQGIRHMELFNAHPRSNQPGHPGFRPAVERLWDQALTRGRLIYGVATDDAHDFSRRRVWLRDFGYAPPGGAWIMVRAGELSADAITDALQSGDFYASTGVWLADVGVRAGRYEIRVDPERTRREVRHRWIRDAAPVVVSDDTHIVIEFIGPHGRVLHAVHDQTSASVALDPAHGYVRGRVTYHEKMADWLGRDLARAYHAWTQPVMIASGSSAE